MKTGITRSLMKGCFKPKKEAKKGVDLEVEFRKQKIKGIKKALSQKNETEAAIAQAQDHWKFL